MVRTTKRGNPFQVRRRRLLEQVQYLPQLPKSAPSASRTSTPSTPAAQRSGSASGRSSTAAGKEDERLLCTRLAVRIERRHPETVVGRSGKMGAETPGTNYNENIC